MRRQQSARNVEKAPSEESSTAEVEGEIGESKSDLRVRPGRRTVEERQQAVLDLFGGKATVDQIARRLGVLASTVEGWRQDALGGISEALRRGSGKTARELELEREVKTLEQVVTKTAIQKALLEQALDIERDKRPTGPAKSRR
jgi:transposase-like protein